MARACANCAIDEWWQLVVPQLDSVPRTMSFQRDDFLFAVVARTPERKDLIWEFRQLHWWSKSVFSYCYGKSKFYFFGVFPFGSEWLMTVFWHIFQLEKLRRSRRGGTRWDLQRNVRVLRCEKECLPGFPIILCFTASCLLCRVIDDKNSTKKNNWHSIFLLP